MMDHEVVAAVQDLTRRGIVPAERASVFLAVARRELVSVHAELRALFYLGVLLVAAGAGLLVRQNLDRIGPVTVAVGLGVAAAACFVYVFRTAHPFSWSQVPAPGMAFEYVLLLGVLLAATDLAYVEVQFAALGKAWPWHFLVVSLLAGFLAFRFDSRLVFSVALSAFAAWRGVSVSFLHEPMWRRVADPILWNAVGCGLLFAILGYELKRRGRKAHFEPAAVHLGWFLSLGALYSGLYSPSPRNAVWYGVALGVAGAALAYGAFRRKRFWLFAIGLVAAYAGGSHVLLQAVHSTTLRSAWYLLSSIGVLLALLRARRRIHEPS